MKRLKILFIACLCTFGVLGFSGCKQEEQPNVQVSKTQVSSENKDSGDKNSKVSVEATETTEVTEIETSKPGLFEKIEESLVPATSDNIVDMGGNATSEQMSKVDRISDDEKKYEVGSVTRAQAFLDKIRGSKRYVFTCGDIKITRNGDDYYIDKEDVLKIGGKTYVSGVESDTNYDDKLADAYAGLYNFSVKNIIKSVVGYEVYKIDDKVYKVTFRENGISIICDDVQVDMGLREPDRDDLKALVLRGE